MRFTLQNENEYLEQMDALDIELGLLDRVQPVIQYASRVSSQPRFRQRNRKDEKRFYFLTDSQPARQWNLNVFQNHGKATEGKIALRFFPPQLVARMTALERAAADEKGLDPESGIRRTVFGMRRNGDRWEVYLISLLPF
ncbi:MAG: hypothetical protein VX768_18520 [Planctomycetota bacterium]|nr:hypothetical protein [Planctomycetota bacterium]